jgi:hypothetical protein
MKQKLKKYSVIYAERIYHEKSVIAKNKKDAVEKIMNNLGENIYVSNHKAVIRIVLKEKLCHVV